MTGGHILGTHGHDLYAPAPAALGPSPYLDCASALEPCLGFGLALDLGDAGRHVAGRRCLDQDDAPIQWMGGQNVGEVEGVTPDAAVCNPTLDNARDETGSAQC
jgi:hypothetical protein